MPDSDSINPFATPRQPIISSEPTIAAPIRYEATPTIDDLNVALRPISSLIVPSMWLTMLLVPFLGGSIGVLMGEVASGQLTFIFGLFFILFLIARHLFRKLYATKSHLRLNPTATAPMTGELTSQGLRLKSENRVSWQPHEGLKFCHVKNRQLTLCHDPQEEAVKVLPMRGFRNPDQAIHVFEFHADKESPPPNLAEPLVGPSMIGGPSVEAITFDGMIKAGDLETSPLDMLRKLNFRRSAFTLLIVNAILLPLVFFVLNWLMALLIGLGILFYDLVGCHLHPEISFCY